MFNNKKTLLTFVAVCLALTSGCNHKNNKQKIRVSKGPFNVSISVNGQLRSSASHHIGTPAVHRIWSFTITRMVPEGKEVKQGDHILSFDTKQLNERLMLKRPELSAAKKELEKILLEEEAKIEELKIKIAEAIIKRQKEERKTEVPINLIALNEAKKARMNLELARLEETLLKSQLHNQKVVLATKVKEKQGKIKRLSGEVKTIETSIAKMTVVAPKKGMVVHTPNWQGKKKVIGDNCWMGDTIIELPDLTQMEVAVAIPEPEAGKVKEEQIAEIRLDSNPDKVYKGKINSLGRIFRSKSRNQPAIVFDAVIVITDPDPEVMRPGMAAKVNIVISSKLEVLQIPETALVYQGDELYVLKKGFTGNHKTKVKIGSRSQGMVEVLSGLDENDWILLNGAANIDQQ